MTRPQAEQVVGRYRNDLGMDRRYRMARTRLDPWPAPQAERAPEPPSLWGIEIGGWSEVISGLFVILVWLVAFVLWADILSASQVPPPAPVTQTEEGLIR